MTKLADAGSLFVKHEEGYAIAEMPDETWKLYKRSTDEEEVWYEVDQLPTFVAAVQTMNGHIKGDELWDDYRRWCSDVVERPITMDSATEWVHVVRWNAGQPLSHQETEAIYNRVRSAP